MQFKSTRLHITWSSHGISRCTVLHTGSSKRIIIKQIPGSGPSMHTSAAKLCRQHPLAGDSMLLRVVMFNIMPQQCAC